MIIAYASKTGNVSRFIAKTAMQSVRITDALRMRVPFVLVTYTTGFGKVPAEVTSFLKNNSEYLRGVAASGNRNWGTLFGAAADTISSTYGVPIVSKFEMSGTPREVEHFIQEVVKLEQAH